MSPEQIERIAAQELRALRWGLGEDERRRADRPQERAQAPVWMAQALHLLDADLKAKSREAGQRALLSQVLR